MVDEVENNEEMLPEEKLLAVIQSPEGEEGDVAVPESVPQAVAQDEASVPEDAPESAEAPKLKLAERPDEDSDDVSEPLDAAVPDDADSGSSSKSMFTIEAGPTLEITGKKSGDRRFDINLLNKGLVAILLIMLLCSGFVTVDNIRNSSESSVDGVVEDGLNPENGEIQGSFITPVDIDKILKMYEFRRILGTPEVVETTTIVTGPRDIPGPRKPTTAWSVYLKDNVKVMGMSETPDGGKIAVVRDEKNSNKVSFLKVGDKVSFGDADLEVMSIGGGKIMLSDGRIEGAIK